VQVPCTNEENQPSYEHPNEATGIAYIRALAAELDLPALAQEISTVFGSEPTRTGSTEIAWAFQTPKQEYILSSPQTEEEEEFYASRGANLYEVAFHTNIKIKGDVVFFCPKHGKMVLQTGR
jgi:4-hydroxyphenylpyruvate dioxygenase-like putative hemolysin